MPRFAANLTTLFNEHAPLDRVRAAADCGFEAFEVQFPYDLPVDDWLAARDATNLHVSVINIPVGDLLSGGPGLASVPGRQGQFRAAVAEARLYAEALRPRCVNLLAGLLPAKCDPADCRATLIENARYAADAFAPLGVKVAVEPINAEDRPDFMIKTSGEGIALIDAAGNENLALQYDLYHMHIMGDRLSETISRLVDRIAHIQFADAPGRHEPGTGTIDFLEAFRAIDDSGYAGWVAAEYLPSRRTEDTLDWMP